MNTEDLTQRVAELSGLSDPVLAERALRAVLRALRGVLVTDEAAALAAELPVAWRVVLEEESGSPALDPEVFFTRVGRFAGADPAAARELAQVVCRALADSLSPDLRERLMRHLGEPLAALFAPVSPTHPPPRPPRAEALPREPHTLATGRPGSHHPLAESHPEPAHTHSVARSDDPHGDTKLSGARGDEDLASGHPRPGRPVSEEMP